MGKGLEEFYKVIKYIKNYYRGINISMCEVFIPLGKSSSYYSDGYRRNYAIVKVFSEEKIPIYILEVGRVGGWLVPTWVVKINDKKYKTDAFQNVLCTIFNS